MQSMSILVERRITISRFKCKIMKEKKKIKHSLYIRRDDLENISNSIWNPTVREWRDVIEDYIYIAKKA